MVGCCACFESFLVKIQKTESVVLFLEYFKPFFCGLLDVAQPHPDSISSIPQVS